MAEKVAFMKHDNDATDIAWLIFFSMTPEIQLLHDEKNAFDMVENMKHRYRREIRQERYELSKTLFRCRYLQQKDSVEIHLQKMKGYLERLENLGYPLGEELARDLVLQSLPANLSQYIIDNKPNEIDKSLPDLFQTIRDAEKEISKTSPDTSSITQCSKKSAICNVRTKTEGVNVVGVPLQTKNELEPTGGAAGKGICFHCGVKGHWKRNCKIYLEELKKNKENVSCNSGTKELQHATKECKSLKRKAEVEAKITPAPETKKNTAGQSTTKGPLLPKKGQSSEKTISVAGKNPTKEQTVIPQCAIFGRLHPGE
ncbi:unnamed protein product [Cuscuta campestris]|uniref:CCHC-type domain-containing protein n=1 Tax=Cuscuta campestris TaxID=132261 RepID=A0A484MGJ2_9ASTE|nr:unnamed protein product [Cuscuta campestris]